MKYLCLVYLEEQKLHAVPDSECFACGTGLRNSGILIAAEALQPVETATTVRLRRGKVSITDGPFAETKEVIGGWAILEAPNKDAAMRLAKEFMELHAKHWPEFECESELRPMFDMPPR